MRIIAIALLLSGCVTAAKTDSDISRNLSSGAIGCAQQDVTISNETATKQGMHNFEASCKGKVYVCSFHSSTGINCTERR